MNDHLPVFPNFDFDVPTVAWFEGRYRNVAAVADRADVERLAEFVVRELEDSTSEAGSLTVDEIVASKRRRDSLEEVRTISRSLSWEPYDWKCLKPFLWLLHSSEPKFPEDWQRLVVSIRVLAPSPVVRFSLDFEMARLALIAQGRPLPRTVLCLVEYGTLTEYELDFEGFLPPQLAAIRSLSEPGHGIDSATGAIPGSRLLVVTELFLRQIGREFDQSDSLVKRMRGWLGVDADWSQNLLELAEEGVDEACMHAYNLMEASRSAEILNHRRRVHGFCESISILRRYPPEKRRNFLEGMVAIFGSAIDESPSVLKEHVRTHNLLVSELHKAVTNES